MAKSNKFEEMLERLVNNDKTGAEELFHEIVVEKSRDIYENLLADDVEEKEVDEAAKDDEVEETTKDDEVDEASKNDDEETTEAKDEEAKEDDKDVKEDFDLDEFEVEPATEADPTDDMMGDMEMPADDEGEGDMDDAEGGDEEELEDRVVDLEDALDDLKAEFEKMMADGGEEKADDGDMDMDMGDEGEEEPEEESVEIESADKEVDEADEEETTDESVKSPTEQMREYVEKVTPKMGDDGANKKSPVAGKNDMGGDASNLVAGGDADTGGTGASAPKEDSAGNVNVPGGKASKSMKSMPKGHGAEKKGQGDAAANKKPVIGG